MLEQTILPQLSNFAERLVPLLQKELDRLESVEEHDSNGIKNVLNMFCKLVATVARIAKLGFSGGDNRDEENRHPEFVSGTHDTSFLPDEMLKQVQCNSVPKSRQQRRAEAREFAKSLAKLPTSLYVRS